MIFILLERSKCRLWWCSVSRLGRRSNRLAHELVGAGPDPRTKPDAAIEDKRARYMGCPFAGIKRTEGKKGSPPTPFSQRLPSRKGTPHVPRPPATNYIRGLNNRNRLALLTTVTEDIAIAPPAIMGFSNNPITG